jgi:threonine dehydratase
MTFLHPFDDLDVITGYATMAPEIAEDCSNNIDYILVPSGGGGLLAAIGCYFKQISPSIHIIGV